MHVIGARHSAHLKSLGLLERGHNFRADPLFYD